jgi:type III restriction enzyme
VVARPTGHPSEKQNIASPPTVVPQVDKGQVRKPRITVSKAEMRAGPTEDLFQAIVQSGARTAIDLAGRYPLPNLIEIMESLMENTSPPMRLSRKTLLEIYRRTTNQQAALDNPHEFAVMVVNIVKEKLSDQLVSGIQYEKDGTWFEMSQFQDLIETWADYIVPSDKSAGVGGTHLYDAVIYESDTIEKPFVIALEKRADVKLYIKLPWSAPNEVVRLEVWLCHRGGLEWRRSTNRKRSLRSCGRSMS